MSTTRVCECGVKAFVALRPDGLVWCTRCGFAAADRPRRELVSAADAARLGQSRAENADPYKRGRAARMFAALYEAGARPPEPFTLEQLSGLCRDNVATLRAQAEHYRVEAVRAGVLAACADKHADALAAALAEAGEPPR